VARTYDFRLVRSRDMQSHCTAIQNSPRLDNNNNNNKNNNNSWTSG